MSAGFIDFIVSPLFSVCAEVISLVTGEQTCSLDKEESTRPWQHSLAANKEAWLEKAEAGETSSDKSDAVNDRPPPLLSNKSEENGVEKIVNGVTPVANEVNIRHSGRVLQSHSYQLKRRN